MYSTCTCILHVMRSVHYSDCILYYTCTMYMYVYLYTVHTIIKIYIVNYGEKSSLLLLCGVQYSVIMVDFPLKHNSLLQLLFVKDLVELLEYIAGRTATCISFTFYMSYKQLSSCWSKNHHTIQ